MTLEAILTAPTVRPVYIGALDFRDDPLFGWTGSGILAPTGTGHETLDENVFSEIDGAVRISDFATGVGNGRPLTIAFSAPSLDSPLIDRIVRERRQWQARRAEIWLGFFEDAEFGDLSSTIVKLVTGVMTKLTITRQTGQPRIVTIEVDDDLRRANEAETRICDHQRFWSGDTFSTYLADLASGALASALRGAPTGKAVKGGGGERLSGGNPETTDIY